MNLQARINIEKRRVITEYIEQLMKLTEPEKGLVNIERFKRNGIETCRRLNPQTHFSFGNAKLPKTTCISNLGTWFNCSGRKENFCEICEVCYDKQIEVRFPERTKGRLEHEIMWRACTAEEFSAYLIDAITKYNSKFKTKTSYLKNKINLIRWAEVGELRNNEDLNKLIKCSNIIYEWLKIPSYIYTHNKKLDFNKQRPHLTINGSNFMVDNEYKVIEGDKEKEYKNLEDLTNKRDCICDCTKCSYCSHKNHLILIETLR